MNSAAFLSPTGLWLLRICLAYLQMCWNSTVRVSQAKKISIIHSILFILCTSLVCFGTCCILLLARDDTWMQKIPGPAFVWWSFPCDTASNLCDTEVLRWWHFMWNAELLGLWGPVWCISLLFPAPDGPPQDVQLEPISSQSIRVTWKVNTHISTNKIGSVSIWVHSGESYNNCALVILFRRDIADAFANKS